MGFETLDGGGGGGGRTTHQVGSSAAATVLSGQPHVWYRDSDVGNLRHAWYTGSTWHYEVLDGDGAPGGRTTDSVGAYNAVTQLSGQTHVWNYDASVGDLRHAWYG